MNLTVRSPHLLYDLGIINIPIHSRLILFHDILDMNWIWQRREIDTSTGFKHDSFFCHDVSLLTIFRLSVFFIIHVVKSNLSSLLTLPAYNITRFPFAEDESFIFHYAMKSENNCPEFLDLIERI